MISTEILGYLKSGEVVVDRFNSHLHADVARLLPAALAQIDAQGRGFLVEEVDFGRPIGESICVTTGPSDRVVYAKRPRRWGHSRFVLDRAPEPCSAVVVILKVADDVPNGYVVVTAFVGRKAEPEPWDRAATPKSMEFWATRALVWGSEPTIPGSETPDCPW